MVSNKPNITTRAMKRSSSALQEPLEFQVAPPEMPISHPSFAIPYTHYAMIYIDDEGNPRVKESESVQKGDTSVFTPEVHQKFLKILSEHHQTIQATQSRLKCPKTNQSIMSPSEMHLAEYECHSEDFRSPAKMGSLRIGDTEDVMAYYERAFSQFQQVNCRTIAKAFICFVEPKKQIKYPYNGKARKGSAPGTQRNPEATKPKWWPTGVMHKEPDHMKKHYRIQLLVHIICKLGSYGITADKLNEVARENERKLEDRRCAPIIYDILRVRKMEERFEQGQVDANVVVNVMLKHHEQGSMAPKHVEQDSIPLATSTEALSLGSMYSPPGSLSEYNMQPQHSDLSSQPIHIPLAFNYSVLNPFTASASFDHHTGPPYHDSPWINKHFHQKVATPASYGTPATSQGVLSPNLHCETSMASANVHHMAHHHCQTPVGFHTESMDYPNSMVPYLYKDENCANWNVPRSG